MYLTASPPPSIFLWLVLIAEEDWSWNCWVLNTNGVVWFCVESSLTLGWWELFLMEMPFIYFQKCSEKSELLSVRKAAFSISQETAQTVGDSWQSCGSRLPVWAWRRKRNPTSQAFVCGINMCCHIVIRVHNSVTQSIIPTLFIHQFFLFLLIHRLGLAYFLPSLLFPACRKLK